jgi:uncharacterized protein (TIRG00374 family)
LGDARVGIDRQMAALDLARMPGGRLKKLIGGDVLANMSLGPRGWGAGFGWMLLWWVGDMTCLAVAFIAAGGALPWRAMLIAYAAGQLATLLPIAPGGLGVTEGSMALTLAAYGGGMATAVAAVLLYRLITYWPSCLRAVSATCPCGAGTPS